MCLVVDMAAVDTIAVGVYAERGAVVGVLETLLQASAWNKSVCAPAVLL